MGLDHGLIAYKGRNRKQVDFKYNPSEEITIVTWRKHPYLHGWFDDLYQQKGGDAYNDGGMGGFNAQHTMQVTEEDLEKLKIRVWADCLPERSGFFWGDKACEDYKRLDLLAIREAKGLIKNGYKIKYWAWW